MGKLSVQQFLEVQRSSDAVTFDVRTPAEYEHARIPGAHNLPLFDNDERAVVGTAYKQDGREHAIKLGLDIVGPKMRRLVEQAEELAGPPGARPLLVHCWRGGMRSGALAWLLGFAGWQVDTLDGGYKAFRRWVLERLESPPPLRVLGGRTGSGKTQLLHELRERGEAVVDLEGLANHRGSAFGALQLPEQPSQEQFEALLALALDALPPQVEVWIEDESRMIGSCKVPDTLMAAMREATVLAVHVAAEQRVENLVETYGDAPPDGLVSSFRRIEKRLGAERTREALEALESGDVATAARIALAYYDKAYDYGLSRREPGRVLRFDGEMSAGALLEFVRSEVHSETGDDVGK